VKGEDSSLTNSALDGFDYVPPEIASRARRVTTGGKGRDLNAVL